MSIVSKIFLFIFFLAFLFFLPQKVSAVDSCTSMGVNISTTKSSFNSTEKISGTLRISQSGSFYQTTFPTLKASYPSGTYDLSFAVPGSTLIPDLTGTEDWTTQTLENSPNQNLPWSVGPYGPGQYTAYFRPPSSILSPGSANSICKVDNLYQVYSDSNCTEVPSNLATCDELSANGVISHSFDPVKASTCSSNGSTQRVFCNDSTYTYICSKTDGIYCAKPLGAYESKTLQCPKQPESQYYDESRQYIVEGNTCSSPDDCLKEHTPSSPYITEKVTCWPAKISCDIIDHTSPTEPLIGQEVIVYTKPHNGSYTLVPADNSTSPPTQLTTVPKILPDTTNVSLGSFTQTGTWVLNVYQDFVDSSVLCDSSHNFSVLSQPKSTYLQIIPDPSTYAVSASYAIKFTLNNADPNKQYAIWPDGLKQCPVLGICLFKQLSPLVGYPSALGLLNFNASQATGWDQPGQNKICAMDYRKFLENNQNLECNNNDAYHAASLVTLTPTGSSTAGAGVCTKIPDTLTPCNDPKWKTGFSKEDPVQAKCTPQGETTANGAQCKFGNEEFCKDTDNGNKLQCIGPTTNAINCQTSPSTCTSSGAKSCDPSNGGIEDPNGTGVLTAIGCIPTIPQEFIRAILKVSVFAGGGIALLLMIVGAIEIMTSAGNAEALKKGQGQFVSAIIGLLFIIFSVLLMKYIGYDILKLPGFLP